MEFLKEWTLCVCITLVISVIFSLLAPRGNMNSFFKIMISVFIFVSFLYPLKMVDAKSFDFEDNFAIADFEKTQNDSVEKMISQQIKQVLKEENIKDVSVSVKATITNDEIEIVDVQVAVSDDYSANDVRNLIFDKLGINAKVIYIGD